MAQQSIVVEEPNNTWGTWSHVFQGPNTTWLGFDQRQFMANFFLGLQGQTQNAWNTQIPVGSTVLSATMEFTPFSTNFNPSFDATMNSPNRVLQTQRQDPIQSPFEVFRGYREDLWSNAQVGALSTTFTAVFGTSVTTNADWIMRQISAPGSTIPHRAHMAQRITTRTGNMTIASLFWEMRRLGNPSGDLTVRIQGVTNDRGIDIPDGVDIAVSNPVSCASVPLVDTLTIFTFPANPTLVALTDYFILIEATYPANNTDYIVIRHENTFLSSGQLKHFGDGLGMDWQNFPGVVDLNQAHQVTTIPGEDVIWPIDAVTIGVTETSPDIASLVQAQIDAANYTADSGIIVSLSRFIPSAQNRIMRANSHPVGPGPILRITYDEPEPVVDDFSRGVRPQADRRILRADDDTAILLAHAFMEMRKRWH